MDPALLGISHRRASSSAPGGPIRSSGWGGFWGWDPVENASVLPWLCATAYLHSVMVQERRGLLRVWNLSLVISTFSLTILGTFLTRSGVITSVHAFSDSDIGGLLLGFFGVVVVTGVGLIAWRGDRLRSPGGIDSPFSREGAFLLNNLLFVLLAVIVLLGTVFPLLYEALEHQQVTVGAPYFDALTLPIGLALLVLMAIGPALPWRKATVGTLRDRLVVPAGVGVLVAVVSVIAGVRGIGAVLAFCLGGFAAASNVRQLVLAARGAHRHGIGAWRGFVGRANGGHGRPHRRGGDRRGPGRRHLSRAPGRGDAAAAARRRRSTASGSPSRGWPR